MELDFDLEADPEGNQETSMVQLPDGLLEATTGETPPLAPNPMPQGHQVHFATNPTPTAFTPHDAREAAMRSAESGAKPKSGNGALPPMITPPRSAMIGTPPPPAAGPMPPMRAPSGTMPVISGQSNVEHLGGQSSLPPMVSPSRPPLPAKPPVPASLLTTQPTGILPNKSSGSDSSSVGPKSAPVANPIQPPTQQAPSLFGSGSTPPPPVAPVPLAPTPAPPQVVGNMQHGGQPHGPAPMYPPPQQPSPSHTPPPVAEKGNTSPFHVVRSRAYSFTLDARGQPIELGSGRFAKAYLGEERWLESKTDFRREIVIKILQKGVSDEDHMRFQMEKELLERVQGHPNVVELLASGEGDESFLPPSIRDKVEPEFMILERLEMSLEERLKGSRSRGQKDDLLAANMTERVFRVLDYVIPIASAIEYAHLVRNICHRDLKPANVLIALPDANLRGSALQVRLADFNVAKLNDEEVNFGMTQMRTAVPGTLFFQSPEQETNIIELLVNVQQGSPEVEFFEDFYIQIAKNDSFSLFNRGDQYSIVYADRNRKRLTLSRPYRDVTEANVRARIQKAVGRPADIYSLGAMLYYLISGAYANPKTLYDAFHKFVEYEKAEETNTIEGYLQHEYGVIQSLRAPKQDGSEVAPADRFFSYKHYLDGNGDLIDGNIMLVIAKCMIRNKPDSYCQPHDLETRGISELVGDLIGLYSVYGMHSAARPTNLATRGNVRRNLLKMRLDRVGERFHHMWLAIKRFFSRRG